MNELFASSQCIVGEGPLWSEKERCLYWIDVTGGNIYRKEENAAADDFELFDLNIGKIGGMVFSETYGFLLFANEGKVWTWSKGKEPGLYAELIEAAPSRFNDIIADFEGRVYCGVAPVEKGLPGSLWMMDKDRSFTCIEKETAGMPNGMGFSPDKSTFYFTVTGEGIIYSYDYDQATGKLSNKRAFITVPAKEGFPDGMTVDTEGCIWSAMWDGKKIVRFNTQGEKIEEYPFPMEKITCITFGGENYSDMYVTTANFPWEKTYFAETKAGSVFCLKDKAKGTPENILP